MDALVIGPPDGLAGAVVRRLRRHGAQVLQAIPADAADRERAAWLLEEAGSPDLVVLVETAPYQALDALLGYVPGELLLVAELRTAAVGAPPADSRTWLPQEKDGLAVVTLGRSGRRWHTLDERRAEPLGSERAAALVLSASGAGAASSR
jgi:NAD(P)-dependent dehydrogenase (short-subunit alcohol dehydrogenase family)